MEVGGFAKYAIQEWNNFSVDGEPVGWAGGVGGIHFNCLDYQVQGIDGSTMLSRWFAPRLMVVALGDCPSDFMASREEGEMDRIAFVHANEIKFASHWFPCGPIQHFVPFPRVRGQVNGN